MAEPGLNLLHTQIGPDLAELKGACRKILDVHETFLVLDPHAGDSELVAMMKDVVEKLFQRTGREIKWAHGPGQHGTRNRLTRSNTGQGSLKRQKTIRASFVLEESGLLGTTGLFRCPESRAGVALPGATWIQPVSADGYWIQ
eukprot:6386975-Prymnesium_polylepis.1